MKKEVKGDKSRPPFDEDAAENREQTSNSSVSAGTEDLLYSRWGERSSIFHSVIFSNLWPTSLCVFFYIKCNKKITM